MMIFALLLIFASIALKNCTPTDSPAGGVKTWKKVTDLLEVSYDLINLQDKTDFILIIGDLDGERCELSRFLRNDLAPVEKDTLTFPHYDVDWESDAVIIDLPSFDEEKDNIAADIMHAFINKIIFERAERLKIVIVVPDSASNLYVRYKSMVSKLAEVMNRNCKAFKDSVLMVGTMTPKNSAPDETEQQVKESLHDLAKSESFNFTGLSKEMKYRLWSLLPNRRALMDYVMDNYAFEVFKRPGTNNLLWSEENRETLRNAIFNKLSYSTPVNKEDYLVVVESKAKDLIVHSQKLHDNKDFLKTLTDKIVISVLDNDFLTDQHNAHMEMLNLLQNRGSSLVTSSFDNFIIRIGKMSDKQFEEYLTATLDHKNKKRWKKLKFELEKLDFFQKLLKVKRTVANFNVRSLIIDQVKKLRQEALDSFSKNPDAEEDEDYD